MLRPRKPGQPEPPPARSLPPRQPAWQPERRPLGIEGSTQRFNSFIVAPNALLAAGQDAADGQAGAFVAVIDLKDGADRWRLPLPAPPVKNGAAIDRSGRVFVALDDGRVACFSEAR